MFRCCWERKRETVGTHKGVKLFSKTGATSETAQMLRSAEVFSFSHLRSTCVWKTACREPLFYAALSSGDVVECACVMMGLGENAGWRKPRTDVSGADIERKREKKYILLVVLAVKAWNKAVQSCFMCVSHTCIVLRKFVYYTWRFKKVYKSIYIHIYYNKADILMCPFTNCPSVIVSLNRLPPELLPQVAELVLHFFVPFCPYVLLSRC